VAPGGPSERHLSSQSVPTLPVHGSSGSQHKRDNKSIPSLRKQNMFYDEARTTENSSIECITPHHTQNTLIQSVGKNKNLLLYSRYSRGGIKIRKDLKLNRFASVNSKNECPVTHTLIQTSTSTSPSKHTHTHIAFRIQQAYIFRTDHYKIP